MYIFPKCSSASEIAEELRLHLCLKKCNEWPFSQLRARTCDQGYVVVTLMS